MPESSPPTVPTAPRFRSELHETYFARLSPEEVACHQQLVELLVARSGPEARALRYHGPADTQVRAHAFRLAELRRTLRQLTPSATYGSTLVRIAARPPADDDEQGYFLLKELGMPFRTGEDE